MSPQKAQHVKLFIPGPIEVREEILEAQAEWMIGHRSSEFAALYARIQPKLQQTFYTKNPVYIYTSSGTGVWESASRCAVRDEAKILHLTCGAFSERWADVSQLNGKQVDVLAVEWGQANKPEQLADALKSQPYDAVACVVNETSTGVFNPVKAYAEILNDYPDTLFLVDVVSSYAGAKVDVDAWGIDICLTSTQKAFALPPGMAFGAVSPAVLERARQVKNRGYYFDVLEIDKHHQKNNTPATPPISLMYAADRQLDDILAEGLDARFARHQRMAEMTQAWGEAAGFKLFSEEGYHSPTVSTFTNTLGIDLKALNAFLRERGMTISNGYGKLKDKTFRIAHMGDLQPADLDALFAAINEFLKGGK
ncbi:MAG TPA: alanine--glyoxylate aminotransferase family protein [Aggregatilineaceae bacterium]|nr:alanine--glyoxylate aminotransferase family protein [Aggregatilineaceae bacterium]